MPMIVTGFLLFFVPLFAFIASFALAAFLRRVFRRSAEAVREAAGLRPLSDRDARLLAEFHLRRRRFHLWCWSGVLGAATASIFGWPLTAVACGVLVPLAATALHLRCPGCGGTLSARGLLQRGCCRRCGAYLVV